MEKIHAKLSEKKLVGIKVRTSNAAEMKPKTAKIGKTLEKYFGNNLVDKIVSRVNPGTTYCVYTEYESDVDGEYSYFVGEEVDSFENVEMDFTTLTIPTASYAKFECGPGQMPEACIKAWQEIWKMREDDLGGDRSYIADFEIYDIRAVNPSNAVFDIYVGIKK